MSFVDKFNKYLEEKSPDPGAEGIRAAKIEVQREKRKEAKKEKKTKAKSKVTCESEITPNLDMIFEAGMSVADIAKKEGISRQIVHRQLKSAAGKMYKAMESATGETPFKVLLSLAIALKITSAEEFNELKRMMPPDILKAVEADAGNYLRK